MFTGFVCAFSLLGAAQGATDKSCKAFPKNEGEKKEVAAKPRRTRTVGPQTKASFAEVKTPEEGLSLLSKLAAESVDVDAEIKRERHPLSALLSDTDQNLAVRAPLTVMDGPQRMLAIVLSEGSQTVTIPTTNQKVTLYPFFSAGSQVTKGQAVIGNEDVIETVVNNLRRQARGDRSATSVLMLLGSGGTGKSKLLETAAEGIDTKTRQLDQKYGVYTYVLEHLELIPSLRPFLTSTLVDGKQVFEPIEAPLEDSPIVMYPPEVQKLIIDLAAPVASPMIEGIRPRPFTTPDPISRFVRTEIINHYAGLKGSALTTNEIIEALSKHVTITRTYVSRDLNKMPLIDASGSDVDIGGLFVAPNPVVRFASGKGPAHVMAWFYNGKVPKGHLNGTQFDELLRYEKDIRDIALGMLQSRRITIGGAPSFPISSWMLAASNTAVYDKLRQDPENEALLDRFQFLNMRWFVDPHQTAQAILLEKIDSLRQVKLNTEEPALPEQGQLRDLFPRRQTLKDYQTPNYRYRLIDGDGDRAVEIAPHTITTMAEIASATRMNTDSDKAAKLFPGKVAGSPMYRDPVLRLEVFEGQSVNINASQLGELHKLSLLTREGESGISQRDTNSWFAEALDEARREGRGHTLTPELAIQVLRRMLISGMIKYPSQSVRMQWEGIILEVANRLLLPRLAGDIAKAQANGDSMAYAAYHEMIAEFDAIEDDPNATKYISLQSGQERPIRRDRIKAVMELYKKRTGTELNISKIALFHGQQARLGGAGPEPDASLFQAIAEYFAKLNSQNASISSIATLIRTGEGNDEVRATFNSLIKGMMKLGYTERSANEAILQVDSAQAQAGIE